MSGVVTLSLLVVMFVATVVGILTGLILGDTLTGVVLAIVAGFLGTLAAAFARQAFVHRRLGVGADEGAMPKLVLIFAAVASLAGSLAAQNVAQLAGLASPVAVGGLAGLLSSILMAFLMITLHINAKRSARP